MFLLKHVNPNKPPPIFCLTGVVHGRYEEGIGVDLNNVYTNSSILSNMFYRRPHIVANIACIEEGHNVFEEMPHARADIFTTLSSSKDMIIGSVSKLVYVCTCHGGSTSRTIGRRGT
jgi:hypothetical protein